MKEKEEYDKIVKEVVKRLVENDLYVKSEKYKWKVRCQIYEVWTLVFSFNFHFPFCLFILKFRVRVKVMS